MQSEVEQYFSAQGFLFPECHLSYWIGLKAEQWPSFYWTDRWALQQLQAFEASP